MQRPGFWDDQEAAARTSAAHARAQKRLKTFRQLQSDVADLDDLAEMAAEDEEIGAELETQLGSVERRLAELEEARLFSGEYDAGDAVVTVHAGAGGTDSQDWAEILLRMYLRWSERRGFEVEMVEASPGEEAGLKSATFIARGENAYGLFAAERGVHRLVRISPFDSSARRHTSFAQVDVGPLVEDERRGRDRRRRPARRHLPRLRGGRPARQQDRLGGADHPRAHRRRRPVPERALADAEQGGGDAAAALEADRAGGAQTLRRAGEGSAARSKTSPGDRRSAATCCTPTRWSRTTAPSTRSATCSGCSTATSTTSSATSSTGPPPPRPARWRPLHHLERPADGDPEGLLVLHHGRGTEERDLIGLADALDPGRRLRVVTPRAPLQLPGSPGYHWYLVPRVGYPDHDSFHAARAALAELHDGLWEETGLGPERTVLGGFSMGSVMSYAMALGADRPPVAGILAFSGFVPKVEGWEPSFEDREGTRAFVAHGRRDPVIEVGFAQRGARAARSRWPRRSPTASPRSGIRSIPRTCATPSSGRRDARRLSAIRTAAR